MASNRKGNEQTFCDVEVIYNHLPGLAKDIKRLVVVATDHVSGDIQQLAKSGAPVKTGALRASGYRLTPLHNDYGLAVQRMQKLNPKAVALPPPIQESAVRASGDCYVGFAANYARYVHDGTHLMAGRPFLQQALETNRPTLQRYIQESINTYVASKGGHK